MCFTKKKQKQKKYRVKSSKIYPEINVLPFKKEKQGEQKKHDKKDDKKDDKKEKE